jgi:uncharacterized protein YbjT (DUF2867 family)
MSKIFTVFGATGNQGGSVARAIMGHPELSKIYKIRAITRDTSKPAAKAFVEKGQEAVSVCRSNGIPSSGHFSNQTRPT